MVPSQSLPDQKTIQKTLAACPSSKRPGNGNVPEQGKKEFKFIKLA